MFRIECFCDDRKVGDVLRLLAGLAVGQPVAQPVVNAAMKNGKMIAKTNGSPIELLRVWVKKSGLKAVSATDLKRFQVEHGRSPTGYSFLARQAQKAGLLKKSPKGKGNKSRYEVVGA